MLIEIAAGPDQVAQEVSPNQYVVSFADQSRASFRLACNRASGLWQTNQTGSSGTLNFSQVAVTSALCPGDQIGEVLAQDIMKVTKFTIYDGRLTMELRNGGKIYVWDKVD
jgi:heat shock protein HslJ